MRGRWCIESWHWLRDTQLHEDDHLYGGPGAAVLATLRTLALNLIGFSRPERLLRTIVRRLHGAKF